MRASNPSDAHLLLTSISNLKAESRLHFAPAKSRNAQGAAIQILLNPLSLKRDFQKSRAECPANMRPTFTPVNTCVGEATAQLRRASSSRPAPQQSRLEE